MKTKYYLLLAPLLLLAAACTEIELTTPGEKPDVVTRPDQREVLLTFANKLVMPTPPQVGTRATVEGSTAENELIAFDVYVFGSEAEEGTYTFQEKLTLADMELKPIDATKGTYAAVLRPKKGLHIKLYCVGNCPQLYTLAEDGITYTAPLFIPLEQNTVPGTLKAPGVPTEEQFRKLTTGTLGTTGIFTAALPMTGAVTAPLDLSDFSANSRLNLELKLTRAVARFDVVNTTATTKLTLTGIGLGNGRPTSTLFPLGGVGTLQSYAPRPFDATTAPTRDALNTGTGTSAFYSYPTSANVDDKGYLVLIGTYQANLTTAVEVTYRVPFDQVKDGSGTQIRITPNHRYVIRISGADPAQLKFTFSIADWLDSNNLDEFEPNNEVVVTVPAVIANPNITFDRLTRTFTVDPVTPGDTFGFRVASSSAVAQQLTFEGGAEPWFTVSPESTNSNGNGAVEVTVTVKTPLPAILADATLELINGLGKSHTLYIRCPKETPEP